MPANRTTSLRIGCLVSLLLFLVAGLVIATRYQNAFSCLDNRPSLKSFGLTIDPSQRQQLVEQARKFAYKNGFRFDVGDFDQPDSDFQIRMIRKDLEVNISTTDNPGAFEIEFYNYDCRHPTVVSDIGDSVDDLKSFIGEIPNVTITEVN